jgi:hypothetical protein
MLIDFQQALADLTSSPKLCIRVRQDSSVLHQRYRLTEREWCRLVAIANHPGMVCSCIVYRANRLAPLALNLPQLCKVLGKDLRSLLDDYWAMFPEANVHFYVEADRFCQFLKKELAEGRTFTSDIGPTLERESRVVAAALQKSYTESR